MTTARIVDVFPAPDSALPIIDVLPKRDGVGYSETVLTILRPTRNHGMLPTRFGVGEVPRGSEGRKVSFGPMVPGPWAYAFGLGTFITSDPNHNSGTESAKLRAAGVEHVVREGSTVRFPSGAVYVVRIRGEYVELGLVSG